MIGQQPDQRIIPTMYGSLPNSLVENTRLTYIMLSRPLSPNSMSWYKRMTPTRLTAVPFTFSQTNYRLDRLFRTFVEPRNQGLVVIKRTLGFTLMELMVTVAVLAVAVAIAVPAYTNMIINNRLAGTINEFVTSLHLARSEAIKRGVNVRACASTDGVSCATTGDWEQGWIVMVEGSSTVLNVYPSLNEGETLIKTGLQTRVVRFDGNGMAAGFNGTVTLCPRDNEARKARGVILSNAGRIQLAEDGDGDGIVENGSAVNLSCP
jgi:type IV fimbrial biogenesis protein FimT